MITCPSCKGKGHVYDAIIGLLCPVFGWLLSAFERNNPEGFTREKCTQCKGKGFINPDLK